MRNEKTCSTSILLHRRLCATSQLPNFWATEKTDFTALGTCNQDCSYCFVLQMLASAFRQFATHDCWLHKHSCFISLVSGTSIKNAVFFCVYLMVFAPCVLRLFLIYSILVKQIPYSMCVSRFSYFFINCFGMQTVIFRYPLYE